MQPRAAACALGPNNMNTALKSRFPPFLNERDLRSAVESVCAEFGKVKSLTILPANRAVGLQCTCLLQLESAAAEIALKSKFQVVDFGSELLFFTEVDDAWTGPTA
jgi:hypothetical protein